jgi:hypothetical protein
MSIDSTDFSLMLSTNPLDAVTLVGVECLSSGQLKESVVSDIINTGAGCVSLYPPSAPGWYVRENYGRLFLEPQDGQLYADRFAQDASFLMRYDQFYAGLDALQTTNGDRFYVSGQCSMCALNISSSRQTDQAFNDSASFFFFDSLTTS